MTLLLLAGPSGAGKSSVEQILREGRSGIDTIAMAAPIKQFLKDVFLFDDETLYGSSEKRNAPDPRWSSPSYWTDCVYRLQTLYGWALVESLTTNVYKRSSALADLGEWIYSERVNAFQTRGFSCRRLAQTFGTDYARKVFGQSVWVDLTIRTLAKRGAPLQVITDGRFEDEIETVKKAGGKVWLIRGGASRDPGPNAHASERWISSAPPELFDVVIENPAPGYHGDTWAILRRSVHDALNRLGDK